MVDRVRLVLLATLASALSVAACALEHDEDVAEEEGAVVGGERDATPELDAVVAIGTGTQGPFCSGVLVSPQHVLTAEHCVAELDASDLRILVGPDARRPRRTMRVKRIDRVRGEPGRGFVGWGSDTAFLTLSQRLTSVAPISMLGRPLGDADIGAAVVAVGYGQTSARVDPAAPKRYRHLAPGAVAQVSGRPTTNPEEDAPASGEPRGTVDSELLSGYEATVRSTTEAFICLGDSGGPQLLALPTGGYRVVALTSAQTTDDKRRCYAGYTVVASFGPLVQEKRAALGIAAATEE